MVTIVTWLNTIATITCVSKFDAATTQGQRLLEGGINFTKALTPHSHYPELLTMDSSNLGY